MLAAFMFVFLFPLLILLLFAFSSTWHFPQLIPEKYDLRAIGFLIENHRHIFFSLLSSFCYSACVVLVTLIFCLLPASVFGRNNFRFKPLLEGLLLTPALVPSMTFSMGLHYIFLRTGISDSFIGVVIILSLFSFPYMLRSLTSGFMVIGEKYRICAANLGADFFTILVRVEIPLLIPSIIAGASVVFLVSFSEYFLVFLIGGGSVLSYSGYLFPFLNSSDRSIASLLSLLFVIIPLVLFFITDRLTVYFYRRKGFDI